MHPRSRSGSWPARVVWTKRAPFVDSITATHLLWPGGKQARSTIPVGNGPTFDGRSVLAECVELRLRVRFQPDVQLARTPFGRAWWTDVSLPPKRSSFMAFLTVNRVDCEQHQTLIVATDQRRQFRLTIGYPEAGHVRYA